MLKSLQIQNLSRLVLQKELLLYETFAAFALCFMKLVKSLDMLIDLLYYVLSFLMQAKSFPGSLSKKALAVVEALEGKVSSC